MEDKITLELTVDEVLMLQELTEGFEGGPRWKYNIFESLGEKAKQAYQKPEITQEEYQKRVNAVREAWKDCMIQLEMVSAEQRKIEFYYKLLEDAQWE